MDINKELDDIIFKYDLDRCYPKYREKYKAEAVLTEMISEICRDKINTLCVCANMLEVDIIKQISQGIVYIECISFKNKDFNILENVQWEKYNKIYIVSYEQYACISEWLSEQNIHYEWFYDIIQEYGCFLDEDFYKFNIDESEQFFVNCFPGKEERRNNIQLELYKCQIEYEKAQEFKKKSFELEKCLFLSLYMRNFALADLYFQKLKKVDLRFEKSNEEINDLLYKIKEIINKKQNKDIVLYWMDAIPYEDCGDMHYVQEQMRKSVVFENAFTSTPYTFATFKNMFLGKYIVDDRAYQIRNINISDSETLTLLKEQGYNIKSISGYMRWLNYEYCSVKRHELLDSCSIILWDLLNNLVNEERKTFYIVHMLVEGHYPFLSSQMSQDSIKNNRLRYIQGRKELDSQLKFYDNFLSEESFRIYMSDHGQRDFCTRYHIIFAVYNRCLGSRVIKDMFSVNDFVKIIKQILEKHNIDERELKREYIKVQDIDKYNPKIIKKILKDKNTPDIDLLGYKGVITCNEMYIKFRNGQEWFVYRDGVKYEPVLWMEHIYSNPEVELLRRCTEEYPEEIVNDELFKYFREIYKLFDKYYIKLKKYMEIIYKELDKYPCNSVAIRMGGEHSVHLFARMSEKYKAKIAYFIDDNKNCACKDCGIPVITLSELPKENICAIILSSYDYLNMLRRESKQYPKNIDVIDIYSVLEKNRIYCTKSFYMDIRLDDEDYDVFFSLDEVE